MGGIRASTTLAIVGVLALAGFLAISTAGQGSNPEGEITVMELNYDGAMKVIATDHMPGPAPAAFGGGMASRVIGQDGRCDKQLARFGGSEIPMPAKYEGGDPLDVKAMSKDAFNYGIARAAPGDYDVMSAGFYLEPRMWKAIWAESAPRAPVLQQASWSDTDTGTVAWKDLDVIRSNRPVMRA